MNASEQPSVTDFLAQLNPSQRAAVEYCDGPQLVIAGAGSGKTRVLTMKVAYLLTHGFLPNEVLALTFTKKAALEMQQRIESLVGARAARRVWMGTFHSIFARILRHEASRIGFTSAFTIYDQTDSRNLVKDIVREMQLDDKTYKPSGVQAQISNSKNHLITPRMYMANAELRDYDRQRRQPLIGEIYQAYWARCYQAGAMDFDDLLLYTNILFRDYPDVLEMYQDMFRYVLVDEYQDTNLAQHVIVEKLVRRHHRLCVVGDDAQSIYSFRGANIRNILDLQKQVEGTRLFKLEQNYRSTQNIVEAANSLISHNRQQIRKNVYSENERGSKLRLTGTTSDLEEAYKVARQVEDQHEQGDDYNTMAILYRTNAQSRQIEEALRRRGIDYRIYGGLSFYQRKEVKDVISYLKLICNPADEEAFKRVVNTPARGIGQTTVGKLVDLMRTHNAAYAQGLADRVAEQGQGASPDGMAATAAGDVSAASAPERPLTLFEICCDPAGCGLAVNRGTAAKLRAFATMLEELREANRTQSAYEVATAVLQKSGLKHELAQDVTVEGMSRRENVEELLTAIQTFVLEQAEEGREAHLSDFLAEVSLSADVEPEVTEGDVERDCVTLMTIHAAKGLEFRSVWIVGIEENLLPSDMSLLEPGGVEEERRLFYVAITRAERHCFLSYAMSRFRKGKSELCRPSRFLKDIDRKYIEQVSSLSTYDDYAQSGGGAFGSMRSYGEGSGDASGARLIDAEDSSRAKRFGYGASRSASGSSVTTYGLSRSSRYSSETSSVASQSSRDSSETSYQSPSSANVSSETSSVASQSSRDSSETSYQSPSPAYGSSETTSGAFSSSRDSSQGSGRSFRPVYGSSQGSYGPSETSQPWSVSSDASRLTSREPLGQRPSYPPVEMGSGQRKLRRVAPLKPSAVPAGSVYVDGKEVLIGTRIRHARFGLGTVTGIEGNAEDARLTIHFDTLGDKTLLLKFAKIQIES